GAVRPLRRGRSEVAGVLDRLGLLLLSRGTDGPGQIPRASPGRRDPLDRAFGERPRLVPPGAGLLHAAHFLGAWPIKSGIPQTIRLASLFKTESLPGRKVKSQPPDRLSGFHPFIRGNSPDLTADRRVFRSHALVAAPSNATHPSPG